jgi:hypothetical protein
MKTATQGVNEMERDKIVCPHCQMINNPTDYEDCNIGFTTMECEHCDREFNMSRKIEIVQKIYNS